jgi:hypothetical protein
MFRSPLLAAALLVAGGVSCAADGLTVTQDPVIRGRVGGVAGVRVKTLGETDGAADVEISFGIRKFTAAAAQLDLPDLLPSPPPGRFYFANSATTLAARVLVDVSRGAPSAAEPGASAAPAPDLAALCRVDPRDRATMAEALEASY